MNKRNEKFLKLLLLILLLSESERDKSEKNKGIKFTKKKNERKILLICKFVPFKLP